MSENKDIQFQFLKVLCDLYDGTGYVPESKIREVWAACPSHYEILELGVENYFDRDPDYQIHAYKPTGKGRAALREWEKDRQSAEELNKMRQDFERYRSDEAAYKAAQEHRGKIEFTFTILISAVAAVAAIVGTVVSILMYIS